MQTTSLQINGLELVLHIGWPDDERNQKQTVLLDVTIKLPEPPQACATDKLEDTRCYDELISAIRSLESRHFHLIEYLSQEIFSLIQSHFPTDTGIMVRITKWPSQIAGLPGGVSFSYGNIV